MRKKELIDFDNSEDVMCKLTSVGLVFSTLNGIARFFTYKFLSNAILGSYLTLILWCMFLAVSLVKLWYKLANKVITAIIVYAMFIFSMYVIFPLSKEWIVYYLNDLIIYMFVGIPMMVVVSKIRDWKMLLEVSGPIFRGTAAFTCLTYLISGGNFFTPMEWGNRVMPIALAYIAFFGYKKSKIDYILLPMLIVFSLLGGRQSFAIVIVAVIIVFILSKSKNIYSQLAKFFLIITMFFVVGFMEQIASFAVKILANYGIRARSLEKLASGFMEDSGRSKIYKACIHIIKNNGIKLNGIFSDHYYVVQAKVGKNYLFAHNFALEILIDFGILLGGIILLWLFFILARRVMDCKREYRVLLYIFILYGMGRIAVSSSIFIYFNFVILLGFLFNDSIYDYRIKFVI